MNFESVARNAKQNVFLAANEAQSIMPKEFEAKYTHVQDKLTLDR